MAAGEAGRAAGAGLDAGRTAEPGAPVTVVVVVLTVAGRAVEFVLFAPAADTPGRGAGAGLAGCPAAGLAASFARRRSAAQEGQRMRSEVTSPVASGSSKLAAHCSQTGTVGVLG
ncbi:MAG TPA: hypothetical protein VMV01_03970, partial [Planctomycetota bacterium]|nr:hypothetical protein [Planctomycetota bacterium]